MILESASPKSFFFFWYSKSQLVSHNGAHLVRLERFEDSRAFAFACLLPESRYLRIFESSNSNSKVFESESPKTLFMLFEITTCVTQWSRGFVGSRAFSVHLCMLSESCDMRIFESSNSKIEDSWPNARESRIWISTNFFFVILITQRSILRAVSHVAKSVKTDAPQSLWWISRDATILWLHPFSSISSWRSLVKKVVAARCGWHSWKLTSLQKKDT